MSSIRFILFLLLVVSSACSWAENDFLQPEQAFQLQPAKVITSPDGNQLEVRWKIADDYYMYRDKVAFKPKDGSLSIGEVKLSPSETKDAPYFGKIQVYKHELIAKIPFSSDKEKGAALTLLAKTQGCAAGGICYPPLKQAVHFKQPAPVAKKPVTEKVKPAASAPTPLNELANLGSDEALPGDELLSPEEAFKFSLSVNPDKPNHLQAIWAIADKYYLYRDKFKFKVVGDNTFSIGEIKYPPDKQKSDEYLGDYEVYAHDLVLYIPIAGKGDPSQPLAVKVSYQGCAESGVCYPKITKTVELDISGFSAISNNTVPVKNIVKSVVKNPVSKNEAQVQSEQNALAGLLSSENTFLALLTFFAIGLGLAFTPCVFPMIPILSGIIAGQGSSAGSKAFVMSVVYVLSMAVVYTIVGVIAGISGANFQVLFQNPWVLTGFSLVFIALALSMFGFYNLQLPSSIQSKLSEFSNKQQGGTLIGVAIMGVLSALIVGPCMAPPLMGILLFISQTGDPVLGGSALFVMSLGMGVPLIIIGTSAGKLMPRAGIWMDTVKAVFGVSMLAVAIWMMERVLPEIVIIWLWAVLIFTSGVYMGALTPVHENTTGWGKLWKSLGLIMMLYASVMIVGASSGNTDYLRPLQGHMGYSSTMPGQPAIPWHVSFERIKSVEDLNKKLAQAKAQNKRVMLDFYADWCTYCKSMENTTFKSPKVINALNNFVVLQADVTEMDTVDEALLKHFQVPAPPAILFFDPASRENRNFRVVGYKDGDAFAEHVKRFSSQ